MRNALLVVCSLLCTSSVFANGTISARLAASKVRAPTFAELHEQYMRVSLNESGWRGIEDQGGILDAMRSGVPLTGNEKADRARLMLRLAQHSPRTFPVKSRFLSMLTPGRLIRSIQLRTYHNDWTSSLKRDCAQPAGWDEQKSGEWLGYTTRCQALRESTLAFLQGRVRSTRKGDTQPTTWGSEEDARRKGGPIDSGWLEISYDQAFAKMVIDGKAVDDCQELREMALVSSEARRVLYNGVGCTKNRFWNWSIISRDGRMALR